MRAVLPNRRPGPSIHAFGALLALTAFALPHAASAQEVVLQNVRFDAGTMLYEAPRLVIRGSPLPEAELRSLLDQADPRPWAERLAKLEAEELLAPELIATIRLPQIDQRTTYREVSAKKVGGGRIGSISSPVGAMEGTQAGRKVTSSNGAVSVQDVDLGATFALANAASGPGEAMRRLYGSFSIDSVKVIDSAGITTEIARIAGNGLAAKPTAAGWTATLNALGAMDPDKTSPEVTARGLKALADMLDSVSVGAFEATGIAMKGRVEKDDADLDVAIRRMAYTGAAGGRLGEFRIEDTAIGAGDARVRYGLLSFGGLDPAPAVAALQEISLNTQNPSPAVLRKLLPIMSSMKIEGLDVDAPPDGPSSLAVGAPRTRFGFGGIELVAEKPVNGLPSELRIVVRDLAAPIPPNAVDPSAAMLRDLGYQRVEGSLSMNLGWNEAGEEIVVRDLAFDGKDMGSVSLRGVIGRVSRDIFSEDTAVAGVALAGAAARSVDLVVDNRGLFEKVVARQALRQKRSSEDVRREYGMAASFGIPAILGSGASSKALAQAVSRFIAKPGKLTVQARAKRPAGFGLADYMANPTPSGVLEAVDIVATAQ